ncbi:MAG TPA: RIO1 family regulatory kinase/ATPase [Kofleriaceae bacterium]|nr:RIO1 family regulatory kinase/ATPase [Kofleriaceae bacterium]
MASPLDVLLDDGVIDEVLGRLKSGKEADISLVTQRGQVLAAKVYKDRATRSFKNNVDYKEGRKTRNTRTQRAMDGGGRFGREAAEQAWKSAESAALSRLAAVGVRVPRPVLFYEGVLLMELVLGHDGRPAPRLIDVAIDPAAAGALFVDLRRQIIAMLCCDLIHGDLSPYNILAGAAGPTIIDFPQVISAAHNSRAAFFFQRDFDNVLRHLAATDPTLTRHAGDGRAIWTAYTGRFLTPEFVPPPQAPRPPPRRGEGRPDARRREARHPDGRHPDGRHPDGRHPEARHPEARQPEARHPEARRGEAHRADARPAAPGKPVPRHPESRTSGPRTPPPAGRSPWPAQDGRSTGPAADERRPSGGPRRRRPRRRS